MYHSETCLPHVLPPQAYYSPAQYDLELAALLLPAWHLVGTCSQLARPGDYLVTQLFGAPLQVRNFDGRLAALSNICAHRHCEITPRGAGNSSAMRCQYHGWEYQANGATGRMPEARNFAGCDREQLQLPLYRVDTAGELVFVSLASEGASLADFLGPLYTLCVERFADGWRQRMQWEFDYPVNWKIPVENSLEAYHVPNVHPHTFRENPSEQRSEHVLGERHTAFRTTLPFSPHSKLDAWFQASEGWLLRRLGIEPTGEYWQHHVFPHQLFSFTDALSLAHMVIPTGPTTARAVVIQFGRDAPGKTNLRRLLAGAWGSLAALITRQILREDLALLPAIQRGLQASPHPGVLGRCEERIHRFQCFVQSAVPMPHGAGPRESAPAVDPTSRLSASHPR